MFAENEIGHLLQISRTYREQRQAYQPWLILSPVEKKVIANTLQFAVGKFQIAPCLSEQVDIQLQSSIADSHVVWSKLQSRLNHLNFLRSAYLDAMMSRAASGQDSTSLECPVCLQLQSPVNPTFALLPACWHALCLACYEKINGRDRKSQRRCPLCRAALEASTETSSGINARRRHRLTLLHFGDASNGSEQLTSDQIQCSIVDDHSSKVQMVISCLRKIKSQDEFAKAIVFSSWTSVLVTLASAMEKNGITYVTLFKARDACSPDRLTAFQCHGSPTWVLLMPIQLGSNGLNLTSANHVLLVDPVLSHGREVQAIARMHRIGQTRPGHVHRFLVRHTIEAALHSAQLFDRASMDLDNVERSAVECMIGAGARRSNSSPLRLAGPGEDRAQLIQMTVGQLVQLLHFEGDADSNHNSALSNDDRLYVDRDDGLGDLTLEHSSSYSVEENVEDSDGSD